MERIDPPSRSTDPEVDGAGWGTDWFLDSDIEYSPTELDRREHHLAGRSTAFVVVPYNKQKHYTDNCAGKGQPKSTGNVPDTRDDMQKERLSRWLSEQVAADLAASVAKTCREDAA